MKFKSFIRKIIKTVLPSDLLIFLRFTVNIRKRVSARILYGNNPKSYCPVCEKTAYFVTSDFPAKRPKAQCPYCGSLERHRLLWLFLKNTNIFSETQIKILHIAAELCFEKHLRKLHGRNYVTADLNNPKATVKMDITNIQCPNETFDIIICNHVLEHIIDDIKAMKEIYRVLKNKGWAILLVPMANIDKTYENFSIITEAERLKAFGLSDHVRLYGKDYIGRLKSVGFIVKVIKRNELIDDENAKNMNLCEEEIYYCEKR